MFQPVLWDKNVPGDTLSEEICSEYIKPKLKAKKKSKTAVLEENKSKQKNFDNPKKDSISKEKSQLNCQNDSSSGSGISGTNSLQNIGKRKNKYKDLVNKVKSVGRDAKEVKVVIDVPRKIKFTGSSKASGIAEWQQQKESIQEFSKKGKLKKRKLKNKTLRDKLERKFEVAENKKNDSEEVINENVADLAGKSKNKKRKYKCLLDSERSPSKKAKLNDSVKLNTDEEGETISGLVKLCKTSAKKVSFGLGKRQSKQLKKINTLKSSDVNSSEKEKMFSETKRSGNQKSKQSTFNIEKLKILLSQKDHVKEKSVITKKKETKTLKDKLEATMSAAQFRYLNELLYTHTGKEAFSMFKKDTDAFHCYHSGFQGQVKKWPKNPVDVVIQYITSRPPSLVVADFGCGEAKIAQSVNNKVKSFDLVAVNEHVTACDMTKVPLPSSSVDIAVFCLSLMGTNLVQYLMEANRVLKKGGVMLIAEVTSRFEKVGRFTKKVEKMGFSLKDRDESGKMFLWFEFQKTRISPESDKLPKIELEPCLYKKR